LCRQHHADWNDGLEATPQTGERESVFVTQQFCYGLKEVSKLADLYGEKEYAEELQKLYDKFNKRINEVAWDGKWYVRTICEDGYKIGSHTNKEGKIFLNTQSWAILSGIANETRAKMCMQSVDKYLTEDVGYRICYPPFKNYDPRVGRMSNWMPGTAENGGCYCHAAGFKAVAECILKRPEKAWETFVKIAPDNPENPIENSKMEPFAFTNQFSTNKYIYGQSGYVWKTGTAAWFTVALIEWILGVRRDYKGLVIDPCLTKKIPKAKVIRNFRGARYEIEIDNTKGKGFGVSSIIVDGKPIDGNLIPSFKSGIHKVSVVIG